MRADTQLDYAVFQLTPTRTRCELLVVARGVTFKLASGLLKPFVAHLRVAEEQIAKGGYSVRLEPPHHTSATWFTKGTMERFVRFVSTPQVLERVSTVEMELAEIEETILNQRNNMAAEKSAFLEDASAKMAPSPTSKGDRPSFPMNPQKPIKCDGEPLDAADTTTERNARRRLLRALDARCLMLQKEQGMAFARAIAAGFSIEHMDDLVSFSECFGASRLREACLKFIALCKKRQESGLWQEDLDLAAMEAARAGVDGMHVMGDLKPDAQDMFDEHRRASFPIEGKALMNDNLIRTHTRRGSLDEVTSQLLQGTSNVRSPSTMMDHSLSTWPNNGSAHKNGETEGVNGLGRGHPFMGAWPGHLNPLSPHEVMHPSFYGFARPGMPYHQQSGNPYMQAAYAENSRWHIHASQYWHGNHNSSGVDDGVEQVHQHLGPRIPAERDSRCRNDGEEDDQDESFNEGDVERSSLRKQSVSPRRKGHSSSNRSRTFVIRNINYITPSAYDHLDAGNDNGTNRSRAYTENYESNDGEEDTATENSNIADVNDAGNESHMSVFQDRRRLNHNASSHLPVEVESKLGRVTGNSSKIFNKEGELMDDMLTLPETERPSRSGDVYRSMFIEQGKQRNQRIPDTGDIFVVPGNRKNHPEGTLDAEIEFSGKGNNYSQEKCIDDSFIIYDQHVTRQKSNVDWRAPLNLTSEMPSDRNSVDKSKIGRNAEFFEPYDFFIKSERNKDEANKPWNAAADYDIQVLAADMIDGSQRGLEHGKISNPSGEAANDHESVETGNKSKEITKVSEQKTKVRTSEQIERRHSTGARLSKPNPSADAHLRAERLRDYKAELQRRKREKEEEERKRIEGLRRQRQERIAARTSASTSVMKSPSTKRILQTPPLNANKSSPSTPQKTSISTATNGTSFTSPRTQNSIGSRPSRLAENTLSQSVPSSVSKFQRKTVDNPVSGSVQMKRNLDKVEKKNQSFANRQAQ